MFTIVNNTKLSVKYLVLGDLFDLGYNAYMTGLGRMGNKQKSQDILSPI